LPDSFTAGQLPNNLMPESRQSDRVVLLGRIAKSAAVLCGLGFACLLGWAVAFRDTSRPSLVFVALVLAVITAGLVSLMAFVVRGAVEQRWRFSLQTLVAVTTVAAGMLGFILWAVG
jgi:hypothetical protein